MNANAPGVFSKTTQPITMPALSPTMTHGGIAEWKVREGQTINAGDVLADIETDKATMALESMEDGVIAKILVPSGSSDVEVGTVLGVMVEDEKDVDAFKAYVPPASLNVDDVEGKQDVVLEGPAANDDVGGSKPAKTADLARVWPSVRRLLAESGLDGSSITPTGPKRTLTKGDVLAAMGLCAPPKGSHSSSSASSKSHSAQTLNTNTSPPQSPNDSEEGEPSEEPSFEDLAVTPTRRVIASRLLASKAGAPHHYVSSDVSLRGVEKLRAALKERGVRASVNDCVMYAVSRALRRSPKINAAWNDAQSVAETNDAVDVAVAVATPNGLITPIVREADTKSLAEIGNEVRELAKRAREGRLKPHEFTGGSFSVSNLGMFPVDQFAAILNPPQGAIMAVGRGRDAIAIDPEDDTKLTSSPMMSATVSADARAADAADVARFLEAFKDVLENPEGGEGTEKWAL